MGVCVAEAILHSQSEVLLGKAQSISKNNWWTLLGAIVPVGTILRNYAVGLACLGSINTHLKTWNYEIMKAFSTYLPRLLQKGLTLALRTREVILWDMVFFMAYVIHLPWANIIISLSLLLAVCPRWRVFYPGGWGSGPCWVPVFPLPLCWAMGFLWQHKFRLCNQSLAKPLLLLLHMRIATRRSRLKSPPIRTKIGWRCNQDKRYQNCFCLWMYCSLDDLTLNKGSKILSLVLLYFYLLLSAEACNTIREKCRLSKVSITHL